MIRSLPTYGKFLSLALVLGILQVTAVETL